MSLAWYHFIYLLLFPLVHILYPMRILHRERIPQEGPIMLCASHSNLVDPFLLVYMMGWNRPVRFMAKKELFDLPLLGAVLRRAGTFSVDRGNADMGAIRTSMAILKEKGILGIFPEGTRLQESGEGKHGAIMLAARTGAKLVPVYISRRKRVFRRVHLAVGEPYVLDRDIRGKDAYETRSIELMDRIEKTGEESWR